MSLSTSSVSELAKRATEAVTVFIVGCYGLGFLIVNSYLMSFGYFGTSLFQVRYLGAGILFCFIASILGLTIYPLFWTETEEGKKATAASRRKAILFGIAAGLVLLVTLIGPISEGLSMQRSEIGYALWAMIVLTIVLSIAETIKVNWKVIAIVQQYPGISFLSFYVFFVAWSFRNEVLACIGVMGFGILLLMILLVDKQPLIARFKEWPIGIIYQSGGVMGFFLIAIRLFSLDVYPNIKPQFGGGLPVHVRVIVSDSKAPQLAKLGDPKHVEALLGDVLLVDSTERDLLIVVPRTDDGGGTLIQLDRGMVDMMVYIP